jgi:DNA (cytosine-5)-methyltransferase 1
VKYLSVCSGIEAATVAWHPLGWSPVAFAEVDKFPSAVLAHHYPDVPNRGDMTRFQDWDDTAFDVLVGGTPCQSFSVAGLRAGLADPRGSLMLTYLALAGRYRPRWVVWENVPGVLSADDGRAFGSLLGGLAELGYGFAYRILDAQYFGLAQRRARVFVVGHLGDWRRAAAVLFERASLSGHPAPRREAGQVAPTVPSRRTAGGGLGTDFDCDGGAVPVLTGTLSPGAHPGGFNGQDAYNDMLIAFSAKDHGADAGDLAPTLRAGGFTNSHANGGVMPAVAFDWQSGGDSRGLDPKQTAQLQRCQVPALHSGMQVRRLTPRECERLQGFPDDYTLIRYRGKPAADGPRYKALGNSMAAPVMAWIGRRIALVDRIEAIGAETYTEAVAVDPGAEAHPSGLRARKDFSDVRSSR